MKRNSLFKNIILSLFILIIAYGCSAPNRTIVEKEPVFEQSQLSPIIFNVVYVEVTKEAQNFVERFDLDNFRPVIGEYEPNEGTSFIIVSYGIENPLEIETRMKRSDFVLIDSSGASAEMVYGTSYNSVHSKLIWGPYTHRTLPPHFRGDDKELFIVKDEFIQGSKIIFYGNHYPLQFSTTSK